MLGVTYLFGLVQQQGTWNRQHFIMPEAAVGGAAVEQGRRLRLEYRQK